MRRILWIVTAVFIVVVAFLWWRTSQPPISLAPILTFIPKHVSIKRDFAAGVFQYEIEMAEGKKWRWTAWLREKGKYVMFEGSLGFFDFDGDGCEEFFFTVDEALWVFKRRESVKGEKLPEQKFPSWFPLPENQWVLWSRIPIGDFNAELIFVTEPDPQQPRKVVIWVEHSSPGGQCLLLSRNGRQLIPFTAGEWIGIDSVEDLDHDGICELILEGHNLRAPAVKAIYKWDGKIYRLWWMPEKRDGHLLDATLCDLDGDGTKEIVALLDLKGAAYNSTPFRALSIYRLEHGRYHKVTQIRLPDWTNFFKWEYGAIASVPTSKGAIIAFEFVPPKWRIFVRDLLPSPLQQWWNEWFCKEQYETWWLVGNGKKVRVQSQWRGMKPSGVWGVSGKVVWFDLEGKVYHTVIASVNGRCYTVWKGKPSALMGGDWDGDGDDELIVVEKDKGKLTVFKVQWRERR
jgi:hypothetical protein